MDLRQGFDRVEGAGGRELRRSWERSRRQWSASATTIVVDGATVIEVVYATADQSSELVRFRYDPRTQTVTRS
ncbi:MAG TPA: hypothetical protein VIN34_02830 [Candidatus Limnocylindria bacterium]